MFVNGIPKLSDYLQNGRPVWDRISFDLICPKCGYNLRGLESARCPECGHDISWEAMISVVTLPAHGEALRAPAVTLKMIVLSFLPTFFWRQESVRRIERIWPLLSLLLVAPWVMMFTLLSFEWVIIRFLQHGHVQDGLLSLVQRGVSAQELSLRLIVLKQTGIIDREVLMIASACLIVAFASTWIMLAAQMATVGRRNPILAGLCVVAFVAQPLAVWFVVCFYVFLGALGLLNLAGLSAFGAILSVGLYLVMPTVLTYYLFPAVKYYLGLDNALLRSIGVTYISVSTGFLLGELITLSI